MDGVNTEALKNVSLTIREGDYVAVMGTSGRGKSTLLNKYFGVHGLRQQRTAIARALVSDHQLILADGSTGALDQKTGRDIMDLDRTIRMEDGVCVEVSNPSDNGKKA